MGAPSLRGIGEPGEGCFPELPAPCRQDHCRPQGGQPSCLDDAADFLDGPGILKGELIKHRAVAAIVHGVGSLRSTVQVEREFHGSGRGALKVFESVRDQVHEGVSDGIPVLDRGQDIIAEPGADEFGHGSTSRTALRWASFHSSSLTRIVRRGVPADVSLLTFRGS